ncbi:MAG: alpha-E domain-containing protein [Candidatus Methylacidiphilales bacterium]
MLSRNADALLWMSRYMERTENIARILDVNLQMVLDCRRLDDRQLERHWEPLVLSLGEEELFFSLYDKPDSVTVPEFLTFDERNPNSILSCVRAARENARGIRDQISSEMWEEVNRLYLFLHTPTARSVWQNTPTDFYKEIKQSSYLFQGLTNATLVHDEGRDFSQVGRFMERADKTSRLLDVKYHLLLPEGNEVGGAVDSIQWAAVLRCCSAFEAYQRHYRFDVKPWQVAEFLIFAPHFPRSIRFCLRVLDSSLRGISGSRPGQFANEAEKRSGRLLAEINYSSIDDIYAIGLHEYLDRLQLQLNEIGQHFLSVYNAVPPGKLEEEISIQIDQQLQMQQ